MIDPAAGDRSWSVLRHGIVRSPGVVHLSGDGIKLGWDVQSATGTTGGITVRTGEPVREFDAEFDLSDEEDADGFTDFDTWEDYQKKLEATAVPKRKPVPLDVYHPDLARVHITSIVLGSIGLLQLDGKGGGKIKVHFLEYRPRNPNPVRPATKDAADLEIDKSLGVIKGLDEDWVDIKAGKR